MSTTPWIAFHKERPKARLRLFCFPYAGGGASIYRTWPDMLPAEIEVYPVQLPSREHRMKEAAFTQLSLLVQALSDALCPYMDMPFAFFGHSMGALIAFELARACFKQGNGPAYLLVSGHRAPHLPSTEPAAYTLPDEQFIEHLHRLKGTPEKVLYNTELMQLMLPLLRTDFTLVETYAYQPQEPLPCAISAYGGLHDNKVHREDLAAWQEQTTGAFTLHMFPGDHFYLHHAEELLLQTIVSDVDSRLSC